MALGFPLADRFQALADPTRLRIVALLRLIELSVGEAVMHSEINHRGRVEVGEPKVVNPDDANK